MLFILSVIYTEGCVFYYAECRYAECRYAECHCAECRYAECRYAERRYDVCHGAQKVVVPDVNLKY